MLHAERNELDYLLGAGIQKQMGCDSCIDLFVKRRALGFDGVIQEWLRAHLLVKYCRESGHQTDFIDELLADLEVRLQSTHEGSRESLAQLQAFRDG